MTGQATADGPRLTVGGRQSRPVKRINVALVCIECKNRNYRTTRKSEQKIEVKKFCKQCAKHTLHRDAK